VSQRSLARGFFYKSLAGVLLNVVSVGRRRGEWIGWVRSAQWVRWVAAERSLASHFAPPGIASDRPHERRRRTFAASNCHPISPSRRFSSSLEVRASSRYVDGWIQIHHVG
jgi:hypothetical protein